MVDANEPTHEWTHNTPRVRADGTHISDGEEFNPTDHELRCWPERMAELDDATPICGYETDTGPCQNPVDAPDERCWQHEEIVTADGGSESEAADDGE